MLALLLSLACWRAARLSEESTRWVHSTLRFCAGNSAVAVWVCIESGLVIPALPRSQLGANALHSTEDVLVMYLPRPQQARPHQPLWFEHPAKELPLLESTLSPPAVYRANIVTSFLKVDTQPLS